MRVSSGIVAELPPTPPGEHALAPFLPEDASKLRAVDIFDARAKLKSMTEAERFVALSQPIKGSTLNPLMHAVSIGAPQLATLFAGFGASFSTISNDGLNVVHIALRYLKLPTANWLMNEPAIRKELLASKPRFSAGEIRALVASASLAPTPEKLDACAAQLTAKPEEFFQHSDELILYVSHANSLKKTRVRAKVEGWTASSHLCMRVRSLISFYSAQTDPQVRERVVAEIACNLDALDADRRMFSILNTKDEGLRARALKLEIDSIIANAGELHTQPELYRTSVMPLTTPGHAAYVSIDGKDDKLIVHVDNRIEGAMLHVTEGPDVYPIAFEVPNTKAGRAALRQTLLDMYALAADKEMSEVYQALDTHLASMTLKFGPDTVHDPRGTEWVALHQLAGNCTYTSFVPGSQRRLGLYLSQDFRKHETADALQQFERSIKEQPLIDEIRARQAEVEATLLKSRARDTV